MRLIDADALPKYTGFALSADEVATAVENAPTIDPVKHGHWDCNGFEPVRCSVCGITVDAINGIPWAIKSFNYCPHCGAKMGEDEWEEPEINPCRGCIDYDGQGGCRSNGGCGADMKEERRWLM